MPHIQTPDGRTVYVPGVYSQIKVQSNVPGPLPDFQIPMIVGQADEGIPYNVNSLKYSIEDTFSVWTAMGTSSAAKTYFGTDSELTVAMAWAKKHGLPFAYLACASALTRGNVLTTSAGPVNQGYLFAKKFGAPANHIKVQCPNAAGVMTLTITPVKQYSLLTADAAIGAVRVYVKSNAWVQSGNTITIGDNDSADADYVVDETGTELSSTGQILYWVSLTTPLAANITQAQYGMILQYDDSNVEAPDAFATLQDMIDWLNGSSKYLGFSKHAAFTGASLITLAAATPLKEIAAWGAVVKGTSPAPTSSDYDAIITLMDASEWDAFALAQGLIPQAFLVLSSSSTVHASFRDWAIAKRTEGYPISITTGCAWGDTSTSASNDTNPIHRAAALNSQDVLLTADGLDKLAAYLSLAPAAFGRRIAGGPRHNLTNDALLYNEVEKQWDERNSLQLTALHRGGVCTIRLSTSSAIRFVISEGISTLQNNASAWNELTSDTPLVMQRDLADFLDRSYKDDLDGKQVGADEVNPTTIAAVILMRGNSLLRRGYITELPKINSITLNDGGTGYDVDTSNKLPTTVDFITMITRINIGE